jgi:hypothetical protein
MVAAVKQIVIVQKDGKIELRSTSLPPGSRAEVIVRSADASTMNDTNDFFTNLTLDELATRQRISKKPSAFNQLLGGWPENQRRDLFMKTVARWRAADSKKSSSRR